MSKTMCVFSILNLSGRESLEIAVKKKCSFKATKYETDTVPSQVPRNYAIAMYFLVYDDPHNFPCQRSNFI